MNLQRLVLGYFILIIATCALHAGPIQARLLQRVNGDVQPPRLELVFYFYQDGHPLQDCLRKTPAVTDPASYEVVALTDGKPVPFTIVQVKAPATDGWSSKVILQQKTGVTLSSATVYHARVRNPSVWQFRTGDGLSSDQFVYATPEGDPTNGAGSDTNPVRQKLNEQWLTKSFAFENKMAIGAGEHGSTASLSWRLFLHDDPNDYARYDSWRIELSAKADFNFPTRGRHDFFDQLHAEANYFWSNRWGGAESPWRLYADFGAHGFVDADQEVDNIDSGGGALLRWTLGNPLTDFLANALKNHPNPFLGNHRVAVVSPMFSVGYNYVGHLKEEADTDNGNNRLDASFFWRWPLAREMKWPHLLGINANYDANLRIELGGTWDLDRSDFHSTNRLTLELTPSELLTSQSTRNLPTFTVTYANGEISPRYEQIQAWLAGFKYTF